MLRQPLFLTDMMPPLISCAELCKALVPKSFIWGTTVPFKKLSTAITSYQGGHVEYFKYMYDLLKEKNAGHIKIFGGGGGTILPTEIAELQAYGIARIYSPDDGRTLGLQGMINNLLQQCDFSTLNLEDFAVA